MSKPRPSMAGNQFAKKANAKTAQVTIRMTSEVRAKLYALAERRDMSVADYLALIINAQK